MTQLLCSFKAVDELHQLWQDFVRELGSGSDFAGIIKGMPWHGCRLKVTACQDPMLVGREGVVIEHSSAFVHIATISEMQSPVEAGEQRERAVRLFHVPKGCSTFTFTVPDKEGRLRLVTIDGAKLN